MLYLVATPIGNLSDITLRALDTLKTCAYILCEDTRHSQNLLKHYEITTPLKSFHRFNEKSREASILQDLESGLDIALVSDAGLPGIADPGHRIVKACQEKLLSYTVLPGASAAPTVAVACGFAEEGFMFSGFLDKKVAKRKASLITAIYSPTPTLFYLSPREVIPVVTELAQAADKVNIFLAKELSKQFEKYFFGKPSKVLELLKKNTVKGEWCLAIQGGAPGEHNDPLHFAKSLEKDFALSSKEAIKLAAELLGISKRALYTKSLHENA